MPTYFVYPSLIILLLILNSCTSPAPEAVQHASAATDQKIQELGKRYQQLNRFSGTILVSQHDSFFYQENFGLAAYGSEQSFSPNTAFKIGEISELFTAYLLRKQVSQQSISLDSPVSTYLPLVKEDFSIGDLLEHRLNAEDANTIREKYSGEYPALNASDKNQIEYNLLGLVIEQLSEQEFEDVLAHYNSQLGLNNTFLKNPTAEQATGYLYKNYRGHGLELQESPTYDVEVAFSSYGLKSTAADLLKLLQTLPDKQVEISGYLPNDGFSYSIFHHRKDALSIIILSNRRHPVPGEMTNSIRAILNGGDYRLPLPRKLVSIDSLLLHEYAGTYAINDQMQLELLNKGQHLYLLLGGQKVKMIPQSSDQFFMPGRDAAIRFVRNAEDKVNKAILLDGFIEGTEAFKLSDR